MGANTAIERVDHTFNPWWGCVEVSPACDHCYAREAAKRYGHAVWGKDAPWRFFGDQHWSEPVKWKARAEQAGVRERVFCASMADVLEERNDVVGIALDAARERLWELLTETPALDWLLLTKRPDAARRLIPPSVQLLDNVWIGTTVESATYTWRIPKLREVGSRIRFLSVEPLLGPLDLTPWLVGESWPGTRRAIEWVVLGGESGPGARPCDVGWIRSIVGQCKAAGVPAFVKQLGAQVIDRNDVGFEGDQPGAWPMDTRTEDLTPTGWQGEPVRVRLRDGKGGDPAEWPEDLRVRAFPTDRNPENAPTTSSSRP